MNDFRSFIGLSIPEDVKTLILSKIKPFQAGLSGKITAKDNLHVNLKFLDKITPESAKIIEDYLDKKVRGQSSFILSGKGPIFFPNSFRPRIYAWELTLSPILFNLQTELENFLAAQKISPREKRKFTPHITLIRFQNQTTDSLIKQLETIECPLTLPVEQIHLYRSTLTPTGPFYEILHTSRLSNLCKS
jgi:2'-5' RNA ligase